MTQADAVPDMPRKPGLGRPLLAGAVLMAVCGGGGFYLTYAGILALPGGTSVAEPAPAPARIANVFVPLDPLVISLGPGGARHLRFSAQMEVVPAHAHDVEALRPRVVDVLNSYLRAVEVDELADPVALTRLRAQMLRRIRIVTGEDWVLDLLIMEFVLN